MSTREDMLREQVSALPLDPGVYQFLDRNGTIIYVGKAKSLRKRVSSYFVKNKDHSAKVQVLVKQICAIQHIVVNSEHDALLLENSLIKTHQPRYNILLKDDKTYPWIVLRRENFPVWSPQDSCATMARSILDLMVQCQCNALYWSLFARLFR